MIYIFNPGDFQDCETSENPLAFQGRKGDLYRVRTWGVRLEAFDRHMSEWYELDCDQQANVQIKVLRAAGFHP